METQQVIKAILLLGPWDLSQMNRRGLALYMNVKCVSKISWWDSQRLTETITKFCTHQGVTECTSTCWSQAAGKFKKALVVLVGNKLNISKRGTLVIKKANSALWSLSSKVRGVGGDSSSHCWWDSIWVLCPVLASPGEKTWTTWNKAYKKS